MSEKITIIFSLYHLFVCNAMITLLWQVINIDYMFQVLDSRYNWEYYPFSSFLYDNQSPAHRFYKSKVEEYRQAKSRSAPLSGDESPSGIMHPVPAPSAAAPTPSIFSSAQIEQNLDTGPTAAKRKRKSRWGSEGDKVELPVPSVVIPQMIKPDPDAPTLSGTLPCLHIL